MDSRLRGMSRIFVIIAKGLILQMIQSLVIPAEAGIHPKNKVGC